MQRMKSPEILADALPRNSVITDGHSNRVPLDQALADVVKRTVDGFEVEYNRLLKIADETHNDQ